MRLRTLALGALLSANAYVDASAQTPKVPAVTPERKLDFGGRVGVVYDDNFARGSAALATARGIEPEEVVVTPSATASIVQPLGQQVLFLNGSLGYDFHRRNKQLDRQNYDIAGGGMAVFGMCQQTAFGNHRARQSDLVDLDSVSTKNLMRSTGVGIGVTCGRPSGVGLTGLVQRQETKNSAPLTKTSDSTSETLMLGVQYANPTLGTLGFVYNYSGNEFPNRIIPGRPVGDGFITQTFGVNVQRKFGSRLEVAAGAGQTTVKREFSPPGVRQKFKSTSYSGEITYRVGGRITLLASADRAIVPSSRPGKLFDISTNGEVEGRYKIGSRYEASVGHSIGDLKSNADTAVAALVVTKSRVNATYASLSYKQSERLSLSLDVRRQERKTNLQDFNYNGTRVGLTAEVSF
ncbi:MAG: hypothetical protein A2790_18445 [Phenylobacterium sp. RIFCSPHIGHO2_01_FULL_69_31]|uniref:hypothetical protein n=1 Tax=Phenylobacterium sp. RIFCSPHIGHO2_01_FULL_69_31 TaxID=1801944 RepID=UPI0008D0BAE4|nr:hypothetical protein [Phenylobacterium sp. RIFCSPHIGHO2_01_FULL_69_31]OHB26410.1 MAG: hypothetical protein A2790_18445 [Phenylobacterium sp. RIFCSPHIGHO2_01_FULL_69_31]